MSWRSEPLSPAQLIATKKPPVVRVTRTDSSQVILKDPKTTLLVAGIGVATFAALCAADAFGCGSEDVAIADAIWTK
ncbi:MAG: hypothetical protein ACJ8A6_02100 [Gemmatimonadales bacterium]